MKAWRVQKKNEERFGSDGQGGGGADGSDGAGVDEQDPYNSLRTYSSSRSNPY